MYIKRSLKTINSMVGQISLLCPSDPTVLIFFLNLQKQIFCRLSKE